jgi:hypothetical protein
VYVSTVVARAVAKNRDERYRTMSDFARQLRAARKRYIAENQLEGHRDRLTPTVGLRHKLGTELPATSALGPEPVRRSTPPARAIATEIQQRPPILDTGPTPVPAPPALLATQTLSDESGRGTAERTAKPGAVRVKTTNTNPLGRAPSQPTLEPMSYPDKESVSRPPRASALWSRPVLRKIGATLGLGAVIGIPPAVIGVVWTMHRAPVAAAAAVVVAAPAVPVVVAAPAVSVAAPKASASAKRSSALVAPDWASLARPSGKQKTGALGGR